MYLKILKCWLTQESWHSLLYRIAALWRLNISMGELPVYQVIINNMMNSTISLNWVRCFCTHWPCLPELLRHYHSWWHRWKQRSDWLRYNPSTSCPWRHFPRTRDCRWCKHQSTSIEDIDMYWQIMLGCKSGMAYRLNLADNRLPIFDQSRLPITDILSVLNFTNADNRYSRNCRYISVLPTYRVKITEM